MNLSNPTPSTTAAAISAAVTTAIGYLTGIGLDFSQIDWPAVTGWLIAITGLGGATGYATSDKSNKTSGFKFGARSIQNLSGVNPDLVQIATRALELSKHDFAITSGIRTPIEQKALFDAGKTPIMNSRHLHGYAVDIVVWKDSAISWKIEYYKDVSEAFFQAASEIGVIINWGGDWKSVDGPHFELSKAQYPDLVLGVA